LEPTKTLENAIAAARTGVMYPAVARGMVSVL
jgi:hypothetical protein